MRRITSLIIALCLAFVTCFCCTPVAYASASVEQGDYQSNAMNWWQYLFHSASAVTDGMILKNILPVDGVIDLVGYAFTSSVCNLSGDSYHHSESLYGCTIGEDDYGVYAVTRCKYCGTDFKYYNTDLARQNAEFANSLENSTITSTDNGYTLPFTYRDSGHDWTLSEALSSGYLLSYNSTVNHLDYTLGSPCARSSYGSTTYYWFPGSYVSLCFDSAFFTLQEDTSVTITVPSIACDSISYGGSSSTRYALKKYIDGEYVGNVRSGTVSGSSLNLGSMSLAGGCTYQLEVSFYLTNTTSDYSGYFNGYNCSYDLSSASVVRTTGTTVPEDTRVSGYSNVINSYNTYNYNYGGDSYTTYNIGTLDSNGDVVNVYDFGLFDESTLTVKNPTTGETWSCASWEYNYNTRSYDCITDAGEAISITYGDEYITFSYPDADGVYHLDYYYYVITEYNKVSEDVCEHVCTSETTLAPGCVTTGQRTHVCELCEYTFVETIPATGHAWYVTEEVESELDEDGDVTKVGYTLYSCENCEETYKIYDGTGQVAPPSGITEADKEGWSWWKTAWNDFRTWFNDAIDGLGGTKVDVDVVPDYPGIEDDTTTDEDESEEGFSFLDVVKTVFDSVWSLIKGVVNTVFGGILKFFSSGSSISDFFDSYGEDGLFHGLTSYGGDDIWD